MLAFFSIVSLLVLITTIVFVYKIHVTNKKVFVSEKLIQGKFLKNENSEYKLLQQSRLLLQSKIKSLEDANAYHEFQFSKWQMLLNSGQSIHPDSKFKNESIVQLNEEAEDDWKEMYYAENEQKVQLENELDKAHQAIEKLHLQLLGREEKKDELCISKS